MPKLKSFLAAVALTALSLAPVCAAELKVGYVNIQRIFRDAPAALKASQKLDQEFGRRDQELQRLAADIQTRQQSLEQNSVTLGESALRAKERELGELTRDFQRKQREFREDLNLRQNEENAAIIEKANNAIKHIAESEQFDLILQDVVFAGDRLDITDKVIKYLTEGK